MNRLQALVIAALVCLVAPAAAQEAPAAAQEAPAHAYVGAGRCETCHAKERMGDQYAVWKAGPHSKALESLTSDRAREIAAELGIDDPTKADACLQCHTTAHGVDASSKKDEFSHDEGVTCEACHGPGDDYAKITVMTDRDTAEEHGLVDMGPAVCERCHNEQSPTFEAFDYAAAVEAIEHPLKDAPPFKHQMATRDPTDRVCEDCHDAIPTPGASVDDAELAEDHDELCELCHDGERHAGAKQHWGKAPAELAPSDPARFALDPDGNIGCFTCHEVHGDGVDAPTSGASQSAFSTALRAYLVEGEWDGLVPADGTWPATAPPAKGEHGRMLTLPVEDGQLCSACHGTGP